MVAGEDYSANLRCCRFARVQRSLRLVGVVREAELPVGLAHLGLRSGRLEAKDLAGPGRGGAGRRRGGGTVGRSE